MTSLFSPPGIASYVRFSPKSQRPSAIRSQQITLRMAARRACGEIDPSLEFSDLSSAANADSRPGLEALLAAVVRGQVSALYVVSLSRINRSYPRLMEILQELEHHGVRVICTEDRHNG
jgi:DNA invertase Pin-like site-specific DNA recombinase